MSRPSASWHADRPESAHAAAALRHHLGSVDVLTDEAGGVVERRSYDPFGQRRNPVWGKPPPASFGSKTTKGFTGHESDDDLGLVNLKGRLYDPKVGRFLTTDPIVPDLFFGQSFNAYSYVLNNPLAYVDPTGFEPDIGVVSQPGYPDVPLPDDLVTPGPGFEVARYLNGGPPPAAPVVESSHANEAPSEAAEVGAAAPPTDVDTTGSSSEYVPQPVTTAPEDWAQNPYVQIEGGFLGGLMLGVVPFAGAGQQLLDAAEVLPHGTPQARLGLAVGQIVGGVITTAGGVTGELLGGAASVTGLGAAVGVPALVVSTGLVVGGVGNIAAGIQGLSQSLMSTGTGSSGPQASPAARGAAEAVKVGEYTLTRTAAGHMGDVVKHGPFKGELARPYLSSQHTLQEIMAAGKPIPDPGGVAGALRWDVPGTVRGASGTWELIVQPETKTILHWLFKPAK